MNSETTHANLYKSINMTLIQHVMGKGLELLNGFTTDLDYYKYLPISTSLKCLAL